MSRVIAVVACGFTLAACSASLPSLSFLKSSPPTEALRIESEPPGAEAKTSLGQSCRTPCELVVQAADEFSLTLALNGYQPQTVSVRKDAAENSRTRCMSNCNRCLRHRQRSGLRRRRSRLSRANRLPSSLHRTNQPKRRYPHLRRRPRPPWKRLPRRPTIPGRPDRLDAASRPDRRLTARAGSWTHWPLSVRIPI